MQLLRQRCDIAVKLHGDQVQCRRARLELVDQLLVETGQRGGDRMIRVDGMDRLGDLADRVPDLGIGVIQIEFVTDHPHQHRRMRRRLPYLREDALQLLFYGRCIVVIEAMSLVAELDADRHFQAVALCAIEQGALALRVWIHAPGAQCVAAARGQRFHAAIAQAGTLDHEGRAIHQQAVAVCFLRNAHLRRAYLRARGQCKHAEGDDARVPWQLHGDSWWLTRHQHRLGHRSAGGRAASAWLGLLAGNRIRFWGFCAAIARLRA